MCNDHIYFYCNRESTPLIRLISLCEHRLSSLCKNVVLAVVYHLLPYLYHGYETQQKMYSRKCYPGCRWCALICSCTAPSADLWEETLEIASEIASIA